tara:strand:- start:358 stop:555 length:198 start_codon:yes stop_codon:yes gene_type:complete
MRPANEANPRFHGKIRPTLAEFYDNYEGTVTVFPLQSISPCELVTKTIFAGVANMPDFWASNMIL